MGYHAPVARPDTREGVANELERWGSALLAEAKVVN
jgi:hypothetical protein